MTEKAAVFGETYRYYLDRIREIDLPGRAETLGGEMAGDRLMIPVFGVPHAVSGEGITGPGGERAPFAFAVLLAKYVLLSPDRIPEGGDWTAFRDFPDAAPLVTSFTANVERRIAKAYSGRMGDLAAACGGLHGEPARGDLSYDLAREFPGLPRIPVLLLFNDRDEEFPAQCSVLFRRQTERYLDMESVAILGMRFAEMLTEI